MDSPTRQPRTPTRRASARRQSRSMEAGAGRQAVTSTSSLLLPEKSEDGGHIYDDDAPYGDDNALIPG